MSTSRTTNAHHAGPPPLSRRAFLRGSALGAGTLALTGCGTLVAGITPGASVAPGTVTFWDLFGGGDFRLSIRTLGWDRRGWPLLSTQPDPSPTS